MGKQGRKSKRGKGEIYNEPKTAVVLLKLTPTASRLLRHHAAVAGISVQEFVERWIRGNLSDINTNHPTDT
jgi:hypothetical protein